MIGYPKFKLAVDLSGVRKDHLGTRFNLYSVESPFQSWWYRGCFDTPEDAEKLIKKLVDLKWTTYYNSKGEKV